MKIVEPQLEAYAIDHSTVPSQVCEQIFKLTHQHEEMAQMLIGPMEASILGFFIRSLNVKRVLEIGTFTGYSALAMAEQLPGDGQVITLDIEEKYNRHDYQKTFQNSPHFKKINFIKGDAQASMQSLTGTFDLIFIDADKTNYKHYLAKGLEMLSPKGIIVIDNVLWSGKVLQSDRQIEVNDHSTRALKELNDMIQGRSDLYKTLLPVRDGMFLLQKI